MSEMETDLSTRLRSRAWEHRHHRKYREEAATRIADLERKLKVAEEALEVVVKWYGARHGDNDEICGPDEQDAEVRQAMAALSTIREG